MKALSINTLLEYTPYDNKCPSPFGLRSNEKEEEEKFYRNGLFVEYPTACDKLKKELEECIEDESTHSIVFSGSTTMRSIFASTSTFLTIQPLFLMKSVSEHH